MSNIRIKVIGEVKERRFQGNDGKTWVFREQEVVLLKRPDEEYPDKGRIGIRDDHPGWEVGKTYALLPDSFYFDRYGKLMLSGTPDLQLIPASRAKAAA
jgi:hypothetical protein